MAKFMAPNPVIFNGKLREIINLEKLSSFAFLKAVNHNYGYIRFSFDKGNDHIWAYADDNTLKQDVIRIYELLDIPWNEATF
jgi:hypothetical protein